jgi:hypothetical protein
VDGLRSGVRLRYRPTLDIKTAQYHYNTAIRTPENEHRALGLPSPSRHSSAIRLIPSPPQSFFREKPILLRGLLKVGSLRLLPTELSRMWRLSETVAAGLMRISSSRSLLVASSAMWGLGGLPPPYSGSKGFSFRGEFGVALEREEADAEEASGLRLGCSAPLYRA